jgi:hypothetical protein
MAFASKGKDGWTVRAVDRAEIEGVLRSFAEPIAIQAWALVEVLDRLRPDLVPRVRLGWGSVNYRHPDAGHVCALFPMPDHVSLVFEHGRQLDSPLLQGKGKQVRFIRFNPGDAVPEAEIGLLLAEAIALRA